MRKSCTSNGVNVNAIAGVHVVLLGLNLSDNKRAECLRFAIQRQNHKEDERYWMTGMKTFEVTDPGLGAGVQASSGEHAFQSFQWPDCNAKPVLRSTLRPSQSL